MRYLFVILVLFIAACGVDPAPNPSPELPPPTDCPAGTAGEACEPCQAGFFCDGENPAQACANGTWDDDADPASPCVSWSTCGPGSEASAGSATTDTTCTNCASGTYVDGSGLCVAWSTCGPGTYVQTAGSSSVDVVCAGCEPGTYSATENAASCEACALGTYSDAPSAASCTPWSQCGINESIALEGSATMDRLCGLLKEAGEACTTDAQCDSNECQRGYCKLPGFSVIPSGTFTQGSPVGEFGREFDEAQKVVTLTRAFFMQETEVTQAEWFALIGNNPSHFATLPPGSRPVERVRWWDAIAFMNARSVREGLQQCYQVSGCSGMPGSDYSCSVITFEGLDCTGYRLPTEAEWEYAARAGTTASTYAGDHVGSSEECEPNSLLSGIAWWCDNSFFSTQVVGEKPANAWGLYDMIGNVGEWTWDWYERGSSDAVTDPTGPTTGTRRVNRGCSWRSEAGFCRAAERFEGPPTGRDFSTGFRAARTIP